MRTPPNVFDVVKTVGLTLPDVEAATKYDGSPVLKLGGAFLAGLATHRSAEPDTLVVRIGLDEREGLLEDAPETYYLTEYYNAIPSCSFACRESTARPCAISCQCRGV